ncbi:hypothetical protein HHI36_005105 [Cryptolaemus montrouzieri]|uniref:2',5'-phosphodiesterase 12 n=1 Tax=Cryptolaemus montrouzieri TaxID=559131 RepID=A0ABD2NUP4_9CUCU
MEKFAHLRHLEITNQCELVVQLNMVFQDIHIDEEIHSVRNIEDTLGSLRTHTRNKLIKIITDKSAETKDQSEISTYNIPILFKRKLKHSKVLSDDISLKTLLLEDLGKTVVVIFDQEFKLLVNPPLIKSINLPSILYATFSVQPLKFYGLFTDKSSSEFSWFRSKDKITWEKVGSAYDYPISEDDLGYYLKVVCIPVSQKKIRGSPVEIISPRPVQKFPELPRCPFEVRHEYTKDLLQTKDFRFVTYNILSNRYTELNDTFSYCPLEALAIDYRKQLILKELVGYNADIICLQEVDNREFNTYFNTKLADEGYISKYHRKGNNLTEGLLCAMKKSRYKLLSYQQLVYANAIHTKKMFAPLYSLLKKEQSLKNLFMKQSTSLQTTVLKCKEVKRIVVIGNTHLYYHPDATTVRLIQAYMATMYLSYVKERMEQEWKNFVVDVIFCGDFNSSPGGLVYKFLCEGTIPRDDEFHLYFSGNAQWNFTHKLNFISACGTPKYTNYTNDFKSCLDYIFIQRGEIEVKRVIPLPEEELEKYVGLPNEVYPSDHIALVCDLQFKQN